jgi:catechol 2,3-dioxygenase-like lactoylglutathione lyase family enzyme
MTMASQATPKAHPTPLGHISIGVRDYDVSKAFYTAALAPLGLRLVYDKSPCAGFGPDETREVLNLFERSQDARPPGPGSHVAFNAPNRQAVLDFHNAALAAGGKSLGEPGLRPHYGPHYFAAFVVCPDGWKLEAVYQEKEE